MTSRDSAPRQKKSLALSLALGALLVPLAAFAASALVRDASNQEPPISTTAGSADPATITAAPTGLADIGIACGEEGMQLLTAEADGSITDVQQAALDALRDICEAEGRALPASPVDVSPSLTAMAAIQSTTSVAVPDDGDDDHGGDDRDGHDDDGDSHDREDDH
jgi:hypothetical protein